MIVWFSVTFIVVELYAAFNQHEIKLMTENIEERFNLLIDTWNEELYFEMYDFGQRASHHRISRGEFAQRMVELKWKPTLKPVEIVKVDILYLNYAVIYFWQEFENKVNILRKVRKYMIFPVILENNIWKFDLTQLIRIPYEGKFVKPAEPAPTPADSKSKESALPPEGPANQDEQQAPPVANP
jgi:hypothetical protein